MENEHGVRNKNYPCPKDSRIRKFLGMRLLERTTLDFVPHHRMFRVGNVHLIPVQWLQLHLICPGLGAPR